MEHVTGCTSLTSANMGLLSKQVASDEKELVQKWKVSVQISWPAAGAVVCRIHSILALSRGPPEFISTLQERDGPSLS